MGCEDGNTCSRTPQISLRAAQTHPRQLLLVWTSKTGVFDQPAARLVNNLCVALPVAQSLKAQNDLILSPLSDESRHTATMTLISRFSQALVQCV